MTLQEYYGLPQGTKITFNTNNYYDSMPDDVELPESMSYGFADKNRRTVGYFNTSNVTNMSYLLNYCESLKDINGMADWDVSNVTNMSNLFTRTANVDLTPLKDWDVSKVTTLSNLFEYSKITTLKGLENWNLSSLTSISGLLYQSSVVDASAISNWDTSRITSFYNLTYSATSLKTLGRLDMTSFNQTSATNFPIYAYTELKSLTDVGGFYNLKMSWTGTYGLAKCPNLTYESCINIINGLYDFTANGKTPTSSQGKLQVHKNFIDKLTDDDKALVSAKGWTLQS